MKNYENINVTPSVRRVFEKSTVISNMFNDELVRSAYVMMSIFSEPDALVNKYFQESGIMIIPEMIMHSLVCSKESFAEVFGEKAADIWFSKEQEALPEYNKETVIEEIPNKENNDNKEEGFDVDILKEKVMEVLTEMIVPITDGAEDEVVFEVEYSDKLMEACEDAATRCFAGKQNFLDIDNLLYSILMNKNSSAYKLLKMYTDILKVEVDDIIDFIMLNGNIYIISDENNNIVLPKKLQNCCTILNDKFTKNQKSDILGRDKEIFKLWSVFSKRTKRNSVLIGEAGVGKTAIVEALVQEIVNETCPKQFIGYTVIELDVGAAIAGTKYRGEFEDKVNILKAFLEKTPNVILFIDEMHQMMDAGSAEGSGVDLSGALKPILSRNDVVFIGSTTLDEYEKYVSRDLAFKRRFEQVVVNEPKHSEVKAMVSERVKNLSKYHGVSVEDSLLDYIIVCASAFNCTGHNPDKTLDLCDRSMAVAKMRDSKVLEKKDVEKIFEENYEEFENTPMERKIEISYHESGHYVVARKTILNEVEIPILVTIVPSGEFLGTYIYDVEYFNVEPTKEFYLSKIYSLLAGRISQEIYLGSPCDAGADSDIEKATNIAKEMITKYSLVPLNEETKTPAIFDKEYEYISDRKKDKITCKVEEILDEATEKVREMLNKEDVKAAIRRVAELLLEKKIATVEELDKAFKG